MKRFRSQAKNQYLNRNLRRSHTEQKFRLKWIKEIRKMERNTEDNPKILAARDLKKNNLKE